LTKEGQISKSDEEKSSVINIEQRKAIDIIVGSDELECIVLHNDEIIKPVEIFHYNVGRKVFKLADHSGIIRWINLEDIKELILE